MGRLGQQSKSEMLPTDSCGKKADRKRNTGMGADDGHSGEVPEPEGGVGMRRLRGWTVRLGGLFNKQRKDRELEEEIESHVQMHVEDNLRLGMTPEEARRQAMIKLGGIDLHRCRVELRTR